MLRRLFDQEDFHDFGAWDGDQPYGYMPHDIHMMYRSRDEVESRRLSAQSGGMACIPKTYSVSRSWCCRSPLSLPPGRAASICVAVHGDR